MAGKALTGATKILAVWGHPVKHSRSPAMQNAALAALGLDWIYVPFDVDPTNLPNAVLGIRAMGFAGVNCTVPLKESVGQYLDSVSPDAARVGSVNTIVYRNDRLHGYTTDGAGIYWDLQRQGLAPDGQRVFIWGAGGSARSIAYKLAQHGCKITIANRTLGRARDVANLISAAFTGLEGSSYLEGLQAADLLINTTTLGMNGEMPPLPDGLPQAGQAVYDVVYAPPVTPLLARATVAGCRAVNGLGMLVCQGALSLSLWTGIPATEIPLEVMDAAVQ